jgi:preprotein translocase subunit SecF
MLRLFANAKYKYIEIRRIAYIATAIALVICVGAAAYYQVTKGAWLNYGVDFAGGTLAQVKFDQPVDIGTLRSEIESRYPGSEITSFGDQNEFLIRSPKFSEAGRNTSDEIKALLSAKHGKNFTVGRTEAVSGKVGAELQRKALLAILLSFGATLIYLAFRFEWRFGLAAVIATMHDTILTLGIISLFRMEVSLTTVAAVLTIVGYSLNDTIIIFDRIRENLKKGGRKFDLVELMNRSINETLPRTILTVSTVLLTLASLAILGGSTIRAFAVIMFVGVVLGTYSSIFVASPVLYEIEKRWGEKPATKTKTGQKVAL